MIIGICDDEKNVRDLIGAYIRKLDGDCTIHHFEDGESVLRHIWKGKKVDVLYLDIDLKGSPDGMTVAEKIKGKQINEGIGAAALPLIIFVTGLPERMPEAFGVRAFHFLVKPIDEIQFGIIFRQAEKAVIYAPHRHKNNRSISVSSGGIKRTITVSDICFIESNGRKIIFHTNGGSIEIYGTMADAQSGLDESFCQIHRSFIVNMGHISDYTRTSVKTSNGDTIPMSKYKYREFVTKYARFLESS